MAALKIWKSQNNIQQTRDALNMWSLVLNYDADTAKNE